MCEDPLINALLDAHDAAEGETRELLTIGRLLAFCEQRCGHWEPGTGCTRHGRTEWAGILLQPGMACERGPFPLRF